jgi:hypothetical protein
VAAIDRGASVERGMPRLSQFPSPQDLPSILRLASDIPNEVTVSSGRPLCWTAQDGYVKTFALQNSFCLSNR